MRPNLGHTIPEQGEHRISFGRKTSSATLAALSFMTVVMAAWGGVLQKEDPPTAESVLVEETRAAASSITATSDPDRPLDNSTSSSTAASVTEEGITISGTVMDASPSARIIVLDQSDHGIGTIALTDKTALLAANGAKIDLTDVRHGDIVRAHGQSGTPGTLLADEIVVGSR